jgi:hypothetical protein
MIKKKKKNNNSNKEQYNILKIPKKKKKIGIKVENVKFYTKMYHKTLNLLNDKSTFKFSINIKTNSFFYFVYIYRGMMTKKKQNNKGY